MSDAPAKKNFNVLVTGFATALVIAAESEGKAIKYALNEMNLGDFEMEEARVTGEVLQENLASARRHADVIAEDPED